MTEGMAKIQQRALALFAFVFGDDGRLDFAGARDGVQAGVGIQVEQRLDVRLQPHEEILVADERGLDDFREPGAEFARRQGLEGVDVGDHRERLVKRADHVLAVTVVDAGLAADGGVHLREQRGGHLEIVDAALVAGSGKAGEAADHAAAERDQHGIAAEMMLQERAEDEVQRAPILVVFAVRQDHVPRLKGRQAAAQPLQVKRRDVIVGDDAERALLQRADEQLGAAQQSAVDVQRIAAVAQRDSECAHSLCPPGYLTLQALEFPSSSRRIRRARSLTRPWSVSTVKRAMLSYRGSRAANNSRRRASRSGAASSGRCWPRPVRPAWALTEALR